MSVTANGPGKSDFNYQWKKRRSTSLPDRASGRTSPSLKIMPVTSSDSGSYYCIVMNKWRNMTKSNDATVNVLCELYKCHVIN